MMFQPAVSQTLRESGTRAEHGLQCGKIATSRPIEPWRRNQPLGSQVNGDRLSILPIGRDLQDRRTTESAVSDQHLLAELLPARGDDDIRGYATEVAVTFTIGGAECQRDQ